jgi:hypothetical protein
VSYVFTKTSLVTFSHALCHFHEYCVHKENPRRDLWRRGGESAERGDHTRSWLPEQLAGRVWAAQKTNMNPIFKHLARRKTIDIKKICFFKRYVFLFMAISILPYSNIIWRRHKDFFKTSVCWIFLNCFEELLNEAMMQILSKDWRVGYQKIYLLIYNFFYLPLFQFAIFSF